MDFVTAIKTCFSKYAIFQGRASRPELWWWFLFGLVLTGALYAISRPLQIVASAVLLVPNLAVGVRRLHDLNRSGWFLALPAPFWVIASILMASSAGSQGAFLAVGGSGIAQSFGVLMIAGGIFMLIGSGAEILLLIWFCQKGTDGPNRYGEDPLIGLTAPQVQPTAVS